MRSLKKLFQINFLTNYQEVTMQIKRVILAKRPNGEPTLENFNFESFLSGVGGFVGIFMGYSLLQVPQMFISLLFLMRKLYIGRNKNEDGGRRKRKTTGPITKIVLKYDMIRGTKWENN